MAFGVTHRITRGLKANSRSANRYSGSGVDRNTGYGQDSDSKYGQVRCHGYILSTLSRSPPRSSARPIVVDVLCCTAASMLGAAAWRTAHAATAALLSQIGASSAAPQPTDLAPVSQSSERQEGRDNPAYGDNDNDNSRDDNRGPRNTDFNTGRSGGDDSYTTGRSGSGDDSYNQGSDRNTGSGSDYNQVQGTWARLHRTQLCRHPPALCSSGQQPPCEPAAWRSVCANGHLMRSCATGYLWTRQRSSLTYAVATGRRVVAAAARVPTTRAQMTATAPV